jgi:tRNA G37 N-methylase Trm5
MSEIKLTKIQKFLENKIPKELLPKVKRAFEVVGDIAITEIEKELVEYEKEIGKAILKVNPALKVVLKKSGIHTGEFRTQELINIAGENRKETIYTENNIKLKVNPETVYFSAKLSTEREELLSEIEDESRVLIMFSGCGPYSYVALRKNPDIGQITSIELNKEGHDYAVESLDLNKNIIKKSQTYDNLIGFLNANEIPAIEKIIRKNLNMLKLSFHNADVREEVKKLGILPTKYPKIVDKDDNTLMFKDHPHFIVEELNDRPDNHTIFLNFDQTKDPEDLVPFLIMYASKFKFQIQIKGKVYLFKTGYHKGLLLNYLEKECKMPIEKVHLYDEIFMPLPQDAHLFLESAFEVINNEGKIHMYDFVREEDFPHMTEDKVLKSAKSLGKEVEILSTRKVGQYAPGKYRVCCDFIVR